MCSRVGLLPCLLHIVCDTRTHAFAISLLSATPLPPSPLPPCTHMLNTRLPLGPSGWCLAFMSVFGHWCVSFCHWCVSFCHWCLRVVSCIHVSPSGIGCLSFRHWCLFLPLVSPSVIGVSPSSICVSPSSICVSFKHWCLTYHWCLSFKHWRFSFKH